MRGNIFLSWEAPEYVDPERSSDWYFIVGIIGAAITIALILLGNILFSVLAVVATVAVIVHAKKEIGIIDIRITDRGIAISNEFFPYESIDSFWVDEESDISVLTLLSKERNITPHIKIPIHPDIDEEGLRDLLLDYIDEEYHPPSILEHIIYKIGF